MTKITDSSIMTAITNVSTMTAITNPSAMTTIPASSNISHHILRTALCLALTLCFALQAGAQGWNGTTAVKPVGSGATEDPYIIATPENLYYISKNIKDVGGKVFVQTADIDLGGKEWAPIGNATNVFSGTYDGQGHTISGLYVDWGGYMLLGTDNTKTTDTHYSYGLFGYFSGTVKNLQIDGARIVQTAQTAESSIEIDKRVAVLVGNVVVSKDITIENIIVRNSEIVGCNDGENQQKTSAYMVGGVIGDIHAGSVNDGADKFEGKTVNVNNIYSEVDISLPNTALKPDRATSKGHQYYVGGILGRARYNYLEQMPKKVIYKGEVNAPMAIVGPIFSEARNSAAGTTTFAHHNIGYAGDLPDKTNGSAKTDVYTGIYYYDYKVWNYSASTPSEATLINPDNLHHNETISGNNLDTYTFTPQGTYTGTISLSAATPQQMSMFQGVNRGTMLSSETDLKNKAEGFLASDTVFAWDFSGTNRNLERRKTVSLTLTANSDDTFTASFNTNRAGSYTLKWYGIEDEYNTLYKEETIADGESKTLPNTYSLANLVQVAAVVYDGDQPIESQIVEVEYIWPEKNVVYVYNKAVSDAFKDGQYVTALAEYPDGDDLNNGLTPQTAVKTMEQAYRRINPNSSVDDNIIVVMGYLEDQNYLSQGATTKYSRPATITGAYDKITGSTIWMTGADNSGRYLGCATKFKDITLFGDNKQFHFYCNLHDVTFDTGVKMKGYDVQKANDNGLGDYKAPHITIVGGFFNYDSTAPFVYPNATNAEKDMTTMTFHSGNFARVISGARNNGDKVQTNTKNVFGSPESPHRIHVVVDIQDEREDKDIYPHDIGLLVGGQTDGSIYIESVIDMKKGSVGRFISGNISYGRGTQSEHPSDSFFGSTTLNLRGGHIWELYGGTLGRSEASAAQHATDICEAFFYGRSIINIYGGSISSNIYGAGAGGVTGLHYHDADGNRIKVGTEYPHTIDANIPYYDYDAATQTISGDLHYGSYDKLYNPTTGVQTGKMPVMQVHQRNEDGTFKTDADNNPLYEDLDFAKSYVEVNIFGGTITGEIYGGGFGYSSHIKPYKALSQAGWLFGNATVNIYGGNINNNIYGGGAGSDYYYKNLGKVRYDEYLQGKYDAANKEAKDKYLKEHPGDNEGAKKAGEAAGKAAKENSENVAAAQALKDAAEGTGENSRERLRNLACVYGNTAVNITGGTITGNIYGGGKGVLDFVGMAKLVGNTNVTVSGLSDITGSVENRSGGNVYGGASLSEIEGTTHVTLLEGYIGANVFGGSEGNADYPDMATVYGKTNVLLGEKNPNGTYSGTATVNASIYAGCNVSSIRKPKNLTGLDKDNFGKGSSVTNATDEDEYNAMTKVIVNSGTIGNNIYGGSRGNDVVAGSVTDIEGDTYVRINGGDFMNIFYLSNFEGDTIKGSDGKPRYRDFNVFGGGEKKCIIQGTAHLDVRTGLMNIDEYAKTDINGKINDDDLNLFIPHEQNPNSLEKNDTSKFQGPYMDLTYRRFSLYGGGYGEKTNCLNTDVYVTIPADRNGVKFPHGTTLPIPYDHQSFFDIAGGGYSGDIGYWAKRVGDKLVPVDSLETKTPEDYEEYVGGACKVTIDGYTFARKVIGGGFYGSCKTTDTKILCGSLRQAYGGSLLGYVHDRALLEIGNRMEDFLPTGAATAADSTAAYRQAADLNKFIFFTENVYGGNDVKGIVGTQKWRWTDGTKKDGETVYYYGQEGTDGGPLWQADVDKEEDKGVVMNIFGGTFMGDVFGAGNGHYRGYYVPGWIRYDDGPERMYRMVRGIDGQTLAADSTANWTTDPDKVKARHRVYRTRPMVGSVNINITGNSADDMVKFQGNFYGGGRECSIGQWNTILPMEDPRRLSVGGHLHVNVGGNVDFQKNLYMGVYGELYGRQQYMPDSVSIENFTGSTTTELEKIGELAYDHWYFNKDATTANNGRGRYEPGFPAPGKADGNFGLLGEHMFRGYFKNIEMEGDVELTFYKDLYEYPKDSNGNDITTNGKTKRRRWLPAELAVDAYDAENITMNSFFLGGKCGYMTNNTYNVFCYNDSIGKSFRDVESESIGEHNHERYGSVYRITMPRGVTIKDKLVMGVEDAVTKYYPYSSNFTSADSVTTDGKKELPPPMYTFEGGLVTQTAYSFDHIAYNDTMAVEYAKANNVWNPTIFLDSTFYTSSDPMFTTIREADSYKLSDGTTIYRRTYNYQTNSKIIKDEGEYNTHRRYGLAVTIENGDSIPYFGPRAWRTANGDDRQTVTKLMASCKFEPKKGNYDVEIDSEVSDAMKKYTKLYGGIIYGGCYNSGVVIGDVILNVASNMLGANVTDKNHKEWFNHISGLGHNIGRVYGGGYGEDAHNDGDTYINLLRNVKAMNVFGGGMKGSVNGDTYINYVGTEQSYIYGAIYGGGFQGSVGKYYEKPVPNSSNGTYKEVLTDGTHVNLFSGNVDHVYGGSCMGDVYGRATVRLCDEVTDSIPHLDYNKLVRYNESVDHWGESRLIVGTVYGGNDISGNIYHTPDSLRPDTIPIPYDANVLLEEKVDTLKNTPGSDAGFNGFPLVGNLYGGSNGNYGAHNQLTGKYADDVTIRVATGVENKLDTLWLNNYSLPDIDRTNISLKGGTVVNVYGGGDMSTVNDSTKIEIDYANLQARAGFADTLELARIRETCHILSEHQLKEVMEDSIYTIDGKEKIAKIFRYQVFRVFGGNNHADMNIQPTWNLKKGYVGSVYSGANFGKMTYYNPNANVTEDEGKGLTLIVNSPTFYANAVYGGGRVGDVEPKYYRTSSGVVSTIEDEQKADKTLYGTTLIIRDGVIDHVYGGNDVSGEVVYGSDVRIYGAISGDVYCAGNGDHLYKYYPDSVFTISEEYIDNNGERYFALPMKIKSGEGANTVYYGSSDEEKILAINSYRPNVQRSRLYIAGHENVKTENGEATKDTTIAYVHGSVYMGGNSATVSAKEGEAKDIRFNIGSHVILNGIFMGSNGERLVNPKMLENTQKLNGIGTFTETLLENYMDAVAVDGLPNDFELSNTITNAYIGDFFVGGNSGSMQSDTTITLSFPDNITIYGKIVGGSNNAQLSYDGATFNGGLTKPLKSGVTDKVWLKVHSKFMPLTLRYPENGNIFSARLENKLLDSIGVFVRRKPDNSVCYVRADGTDSTAYNGSTYLTPGRCNIYGGCYNSGTVVGNVKVDLYSDMLLYGLDGKGIPEDNSDAAKAAALQSLHNRQRTVVNGIEDKQWRTFAVVGGGYGANTMMKGDISVRLLPDTGEDCEYYESGAPGEGKTRKVIQHPSCATIFGGSQLGTVVGNTTIEMRDGTVLTNMYGASESNYMYGSTQTIIGYPTHYVCEVNGEYPLDRADTLSRMNDKQNHDGTDIVKRSVWYRKGDIVPNNVFERIKAKDPSQATIEGEGRNFSLCDDDSPMKFGVKWDSIYISVGDPASRQAHLASTDIATAIEKTPYYGHGNIYGGGFIPTGASGLIGEKTVKKFTAGYIPAALKDDSDSTKYGGNTSIMIWDNPDNASKGTWSAPVKKYTVSSGEAQIRDHISIGTAKFVPDTLIEGQDKMGYYYLDGTSFKHQPSGTYTSEDSGKRFYKIESDGGIYGNGRKVFCEGFRACDLAYYGYADYTPQMPKLINSFQRLDLLDVTDCCLQLQGSQDFATNTVDATTYSMTRVAELRMNSSLTGNLEAGINDTINIGNTIHDTPRSRNMLAFFHYVKYLGALVSNVGVDSLFHNRKGEEINSDSTYFQKKEKIIDTYYNSNRDNDALTAFKKRNLGTAANMIGINNGYQLKLQGVYTATDSKGNVVDSIYYGPAIGVAEVKLLTLAIGEGGGYIYALNQHDPDTTKQTFQQTIGNFVFPGAHFAMGATEATDATLNYIIDDCFPEGQGYDHYKTASTVNVNDEQEIHYWYVNGQRYFFNATLTAWTSNKNSETSPNQFYLDNSDNLIMLSGLTKDSKNLRIKSIKWTDQSGESYSYDLTRKENETLIPGYNLYLTIDSETQNTLTPDTTNKNGAWVAKLSRDMVYVQQVDSIIEGLITKPEYKTDSVNLVENNNGTYGQKTINGSQVDNVPRLGIRLEDAVDNNAKNYYQEHLSKPAEVQIVVAADNPAGVNTTGTLGYEYTINLTITYLKGVSVYGNIVIENCALPGEMIYANTIDVQDETDENFASQMTRKWVLYRKDNKNEPTYNEIPTSFYTMPNDDSRIAIPAYYWMNGWDLAYVVEANGITERLHPSDSADHKAITVHNYHRMYPDGLREGNIGTTPLIDDLQLVSGARVYINNEKDMEEFFKYMNSVQDATHNADTLLAAHRGHIGAMELAAAYDTIVEVNKQYANGIHFILQNDISMPVSSDTVYAFAGILSGNGRVIEMGENTQFMRENRGRVYNLGFHSTRGDSEEVKVIGTNNGRIQNCFYYNDNANGKLYEGTVGDVDNCYSTETGNYDLFKYGRVAYDLNKFYLEERNKRLNNSSEQKDPYVYDYYGDGEYRYANWSEYNEATALRTAETPNYRDKQGLGTMTPEERLAIETGAAAAVFGKRSTYHNTAHLVDDSRVLNEDSIYLPNYPNDFIFFGQTLNEDEDTHADIHPKALSADFSNRVFRASGFYGSSNNEGFYFNRDAQVRQPSITAIDFTGTQTPSQSISYLPVLDLPMERVDTSTTNPEQMKLEGFRVIGNTTIEKKDSVTKNLLVYTLYDNAENDKVVGTYMVETPENDIIYHRIDSITEGGFKARGGILHLVDKQDFNAPIGFHADSIWYERVPEKFSSGDNAWEGLSLPFTAKYVRARSKTNATDNHGLLTHFFGKEGEDVYSDGTPRSHEYWLRKFTGIDTKDNVTAAKFHRPRSEQDSISNGVSKKANISNTSGGSGLPNYNEDEELIDFHYSNTYYSKAYGKDTVGYIQDPSHIRPQYTADSVDYKNYPLITAGFPYIVTYPGVRYYEFDLSGEFYKKCYPMSDATPQIISYENSNYDVPVTDSICKVFKHGDYAFVPVFMHEDSSAYKANPVTEIVKDNNGADKMDANEVYKIMTTTFESNTPVIPFRAYLSSSSPISSIAIGTRAIEALEEEEKEQENKYEGVNLFVRGNDLVITSDHDFECPLYGYSGSLYRMLTVKAGMNVYKNLSSGVYIALGHKFVVRNKK